MTRPKLSPWSDWRAIDLCGVDWLEDLVSPNNPNQPGGFVLRRHADPRSGAYGPLTPPGTGAGAFPNPPSIRMAKDTIDWNVTTPVDQSVVGNTIDKIITIPGNFSIALPEVGPFVPVLCYCTCICVPDFAQDGTQRGNLVDWDGALGTDNPMGEGALRRAIQFEHFFTPIHDDVTLAIPQANLADFPFFMTVKFRGYGAPVDGDQTQDTVVGPVAPIPGGSLGPGIGEPTAFPGMALDGTPGAEPLVSFAAGDGGISARVQHIVEIPNSVSPGDVMEIYGVFPINNANLNGLLNHPGIQWNYAKYRFITPPYPFVPNGGLQLLASDEEGQPRTDFTQYEP